MKTFAIGDVHGQFSTLKKLLAQLPIDWKEDELVFLGDLVDRGLESKEVIDFVMDLQEKSSLVHVIKGNHESMLIKSYENEEDFPNWLSNGGDTTYDSYCKSSRVTWKNFNEDFPIEVYEYLKERPIRYENEHAIFVHAGAWRDTKGEWRTDTELITLWYRGRDFFRKYQGKTIVVGHTPTNKIRYMLGEDLTPSDQMRAWRQNNIIAIDCGAGHQGRLCAVELPSNNLYYQKVES